MSLDWGVRDKGFALREAERFSIRGPEPDERPVSIRRRLLRVVAIVALLPFVLTLVYSVVPPVSTLMLGRWATFQPVSRDWVPLEEISPALPRAVIASEDALFCSHQGVDWGALRTVIEEADEDGPARGASTITMQVAKNLFLWPGAGYIRKPLEIVLAHWIDLVWSKRRIIEVYLNVVEWGPRGVFGAEASARRAFGRNAADLSAHQAAIMTAALPNPVIRDPARPTRVQLRRAAGIGARTADTSCISG